MGCIALAQLLAAHSRIDEHQTGALDHQPIDFARIPDCSGEGP
jgi:hypothetical protein